MGIILKYEEGQTPIDEEEKEEKRIIEHLQHFY
jgi:hypothetical protein